MKIGVYAIIDRKAEILIGGLQLHRHPAAAIRQFSDIGLTPDTMVNRHPEDFDLLHLGDITDKNTIEALPEYNVVITGQAWAAAQAAPTEYNKDLRP